MPHSYETDGATIYLNSFATIRAEADLACKSQHLSPATLMRELAALQGAKPPPVYITHTKPREGRLIMHEVQALDLGALRPVDLQSVQILQV